jgi:hypothetical protein
MRDPVSHPFKSHRSLPVLLRETCDMEAISLQVQVIFQLSKFSTHLKSSRDRRVYIEWWEFQGQLTKTEGANWSQGAERTLLLYNSWYYSSESIWGSCERPSVVQGASYNSHIQPYVNTSIQCFWKRKPARYYAKPCKPWWVVYSGLLYFACFFGEKTLR